MPLVRIDLVEGRSPEQRRAIGEVVHQAMVATLGVPADDRFQILAEHAAERLTIDSGYLGIARTAECVIVQITLNEGRTTAMKREFYRSVAEGLHARIGLRREDVTISLVEVKKENWSFGNGEAQYAKD